MLHPKPPLGACLFDLIRQHYSGNLRGVCTHMAGCLGVKETLVYKWFYSERYIAADYVDGLEALFNLTPAERAQLTQANEDLKALRKKGQTPPPFPPQSLPPSGANGPAGANGASAPPSPAGPVPSGHPYVGQEPLMRASIALLQQAQTLQNPHSETIYLTFHGSGNTFNLAGLHEQWHAELKHALERGWDVEHICRLDDGDVMRTRHIVEGLLQFLGARGEYNLQLYPTPRGILLPPRDLLVVPGHGAILCYATDSSDQIDAGIPLSGAAELSILIKHIRQVRGRTESLLTKYLPESDNRPFLDAVAAAEEPAGARFLVKRSLSSLTWPEPFFRGGNTRWLEAAGWRNGGATQFGARHLRRLDDFREHVTKYPYRDMCSKRAIKELVDNGVYQAGDRMPPGFQIDVPERIAHIESAIALLKAYDNYELALVDEQVEDDFFPALWELKSVDQGGGVALVEAWYAARNGRKLSKHYRITQSDLVMAFREHANYLWNSSKIPPQDRNKPDVIRWLDRQLGRLKAKLGI